jgi:hypothetical protein
MITAAIHGKEGETLTLEVRFYDPVLGAEGDSVIDLAPGESYLDLPYALWEVHVGHLVEVREDGSLIRR